MSIRFILIQNLYSQLCLYPTRRLQEQIRESSFQEIFRVLSMRLQAVLSEPVVLTQKMFVLKVCLNSEKSQPVISLLVTELTKSVNVNRTGNRLKV